MTATLAVGGILLAASLGAASPVVVLPDAPTAVERSAADELADGLHRVLDADIRVVAESAAPADAPRLSVGATRASRTARGDAPWRPDAVFLKSVPGGVVLDGDPVRAPIYAVDLYLERYCGVRWWTSTASTYPRRDAVPLAGVDLDYAPPFAYRETYYLDGFDPRFKVRAKGNFSSLTRYMLTDMRFVPPELGGNHRLYFFEGRHSAYHSFFEVLPPATYFKDHPEWYSLVKGQRVAKQLCLANAEMRAEYIRETLRRLRADPSVDFIQVSQNDWNGACTCPACQALEAADGGVFEIDGISIVEDAADTPTGSADRHVGVTFATQSTTPGMAEIAWAGEGRSGLQRETVWLPGDGRRHPGRH